MGEGRAAAILRDVTARTFFNKVRKILVTVNGIRTIHSRVLDKGFVSKFCEGSRVQNETAEKGWTKMSKYSEG